jgi:hypothetical protein
MAVGFTVFKDYKMLSCYTQDSSYLSPIPVGSLKKPLNETSGSISDAVPIWISNTGDSKLCNICISAENGSCSSFGGTTDIQSASLVEFALDNGSSAPPKNQQSPPSVFVRATPPSDKAYLYISNIITVSGQKKALAELGEDDDCRTMMPGEYCIAWIRGRTDTSSDVIGPGIKNILLTVTSVEFDVSMFSSIGLRAQTVVMLKLRSDIQGSVFIGDMIARWRLNEGSGEWAYDSKSTNNALIYGASWWNTGIAGKSLALDSGSVINCGTKMNLNPGLNDFTISAWLKVPDFESGTVISKHDGVSGYVLKVLADGSVSFEICDMNGLSSNIVFGDKISDTGWHNIVVSVNRALMRLEACMDASSQIFSPMDSGIAEVECPSDLIIGSGISGRVNEVSVYNRVLYYSEINAEYQFLLSPYLAEYAITEDGEYITDDNGRFVTEEVI